MNVSEWIDLVDEQRRKSLLLRRGEWHGYLNDGPGAMPFEGAYVLCRWEKPSIAVAHDDPGRALTLAATVESALPVGGPA